MHAFSYAEFTTRNLGFVSEREQLRLRHAHVYVCGTGGMGGACVEALIRAGVGRLTLADIDRFEISNLNRQIAADLESLGEDKAGATAARCRRINPEAVIDVRGREWPESIAATLADCDVVVNGTDDLGASLLLYRTAREFGKPVVDAYASPLPSVYVTRAGQPMPEERLGYPTIGVAWNAVDNAHRQAALMAEITYVLMHSTSRRYVDHALSAQMAAGQRSRMSFAPMVITAGMLMAFEAVGLILERPSSTDHRGWFLNPYTARAERPRPAWLAAAMKPFVQRFLRGMLANGGDGGPDGGNVR